MQNNSISDADLVYITDDIFEKIQRYTINKDDLYLTIAGTIGRVGEVPEIFDGMNLTENALKLTNISICKKYLMQILNTKLVQDYFESTYHQVAMPKLSLINASKTIIPVPPLDEQQKIVNEIDNVFSITNNLDIDIVDLEDLITRTKSKILDLAIHGKLVPQSSNDEPAEELLKRIATSDNRPYKKFEDEAPFTIPKSWSWCTLGEICKITSGNTLPKEEEKLKGQYIYIKVGDMNLPENSKEITTSKTFIDNIKYEKQLIEKHSIVFPKRGGALLTNKKRLVIKSPILMDLNLMALTPIIKDVLPYIFNWFSLIDLGSINNGSNIPQINNKDINPLLIPLPPLAEQHRIVSKIEELFSYLDTIASNLE